MLETCGFLQMKKGKTQKKSLCMQNDAASASSEILLC
jgi:hypothetical protein